MLNNLILVKLYVLKWIWFGSNSFGHIKTKRKMIQPCFKSINWLLLLISFQCHFMDGEIRNSIQKIFMVSFQDHSNILPCFYIGIKPIYINIMLSIWYCPYQKDLIISKIWYTRYDMGHVIWTIGLRYFIGGSQPYTH